MDSVEGVICIMYRGYCSCRYELKCVISMHIAVQENAIVKKWLQALQVSQIASGRLLAALSLLDTNLGFWMRRLDEGGHFWFSLLRRGPMAFFKKIAHGVSVVSGKREERRQGQVESYDAALVETRVLLFRVLRAELCEAVATVHTATALLHLQGEDGVGLQEGVSETGHGRTTGGEEISPERVEVHVDHNQNDREDMLFRRTEESVNASMAAIIDAFKHLQSRVDDILKGQMVEEMPSRDADRAAFSDTLLRALGIDKLKRAWTQQQIADTPQRPRMLTTPRRVYSLRIEDDDLLKQSLKIVGCPDIIMEKDSITVHEALSVAYDSCNYLQQNRPLIQLPRWMLMPTHAQQHWLRYTAIGVGILYGGVFIVKHSPICGSKDLENWSRSILVSIQSAWSTHVISPLENLQGELFNTFRRRPSIVSMDEYEADRDSLSRMLSEFKRDASRKGKVPKISKMHATDGPTETTTATTDDSLLEGMEVMMHCYENELKRPIKNLVAGDLMRSLLIQVQKMKVDTESAMLEIDQILKANELSISLVAAIPAFILGGASLYAIGKTLTPSPPDPRREAVAARLAMIDVERALEALVPPQGQTAHTPSQEQVGEFWFRLAVAYDETESLYQRHKGILRLAASSEEWNQLRGDILSLALPQSEPEVKLRSAARMLRVYSIYQR